MPLLLIFTRIETRVQRKRVYDPCHLCVIQLDTLLLEKLGYSIICVCKANTQMVRKTRCSMETALAILVENCVLFEA